MIRIARIFLLNPRNPHNPRTFHALLLLFIPTLPCFLPFAAGGDEVFTPEEGDEAAGEQDGADETNLEEAFPFGEDGAELDEAVGEQGEEAEANVEAGAEQDSNNEDDKAEGEQPEGVAGCLE